jgi:hypothetical protein
MSTSQEARTTTSRLVRWELSWLCVELAGIAIGLGLMLGTELDEHGGYLLLVVCALSFHVRWRHYASLRKPS